MCVFGTESSGSNMGRIQKDEEEGGHEEDDGGGETERATLSDFVSVKIFKGRSDRLFMLSLKH